MGRFTVPVIILALGLLFTTGRLLNVGLNARIVMTHGTVTAGEDFKSTSRSLFWNQRVFYEFTHDGRTWDGNDSVVLPFTRYLPQERARVYFSKSQPGDNGLLTRLLEDELMVILALLILSPEVLRLGRLFAEWRKSRA